MGNILRDEGHIIVSAAPWQIRGFRDSEKLYTF
jgi:hypothetical protein